MADQIRDIIQTFSKEEKREFRAFINRQRTKKNRKDLRLFDLFCEEKEYKPQQIIAKVFPNSNSNAYHSNRKRLLKHLMDFVMIKRMDDDTTSASRIMALIALVGYLFDHKKQHTAWAFLFKAEMLALNNDQFDLLDNIYNLQIQNAVDSQSPPLEKILEKWRLNKKLADEDERAEIAASIIKIKLAEFKSSPVKLDIHEFVNATLKEYNLENAIIERPRMLYRFMSMIRGLVLATKEYYDFESLLIYHYEKVNREIGFEKKDHLFKLHLLYMISHVLYRNRKFDKALEYLSQFEENIYQFRKSYFDLFYPKYVLLMAAVRSYQGYNSESIALLEKVLAKDKNRLDTKQRMNMHLNLAVYFFQQDEFRKSNQVLIQLGHTDNWFKKSMGAEWLARKNLIEIITQYELGHVDIVENRIRSFKKQHEKLMKLKTYQRIQTFIGFIEDCINNPDWVSSDDYENHVNNTIKRLPLQREDILAMAFYCWLKSKMLKKPYYQVLVEVVNEKI